MQHLVIAIAAVVLLLLVVRFLLLVRRDVGWLMSCCESAGWLLLASVVLGPAFVLATFAATGGDARESNSSAANHPPAAIPAKPAANNSRPQPPSETLANRPPATETAIEQPPAIETLVPESPVRVTLAGRTPASDAGDEQPAATGTDQEQPPAPAQPPRDRMTRRELLAELHAETVKKFVNAPGFGFERRIILRNKEFDSPEKDRLYLPRNPILAGGPQPTVTVEIALPDRSCWTRPQPVQENQEQLLRLVQRLQPAQSTGLTESGSTEVSIVPRQTTPDAHRTGLSESGSQPIEPDSQNPAPRVVQVEPEWDEWEVSDWELVSILQHDPPVVYASRDMQRMHRLSRVATRPLDDLEQRSLAALRKGETLTVDSGVNAIRAVGAVRATKKCVACHEVKQGDLLGAFTYELHRLRPIALAARIGE